MYIFKCYGLFHLYVHAFRAQQLFIFTCEEKRWKCDVKWMNTPHSLFLCLSLCWSIWYMYICSVRYHLSVSQMVSELHFNALLAKMRVCVFKSTSHKDFRFIFFSFFFFFWWNMKHSHLLISTTLLLFIIRQQPYTIPHTLVSPYRPGSYHTHIHTQTLYTSHFVPVLHSNHTHQTQNSSCCILIKVKVNFLMSFDMKWWWIQGTCIRQPLFNSSHATPYTHNTRSIQTFHLWKCTVIQTTSCEYSQWKYVTGRAPCAYSAICISRRWQQLFYIGHEIYVPRHRHCKWIEMYSNGQEEVDEKRTWKQCKSFCSNTWSSKIISLRPNERGMLPSLLVNCFGEAHERKYNT